MQGPGNLAALARMISAVGEDMARGDQDQQAAGVVLDALQTAIQLNCLRELAALVRPWIDEKMVESMDGPVQDKSQQN
jgi:hypothetical protein